MWGFGSDGYLYDFAKRSSEIGAKNPNMWGFGPNGFLNDFDQR